MSQGRDSETDERAVAELGAKAPEERRERILRATITVVRERGFAGTRVADIAELAGVSQGLILYHFGSLNGALTQALQFIEDQYHEEVSRELSTVTQPEQRLRKILELSIGTGNSVGDWRLWLEIWVRALHDADARAIRDTLESRWRASLLDVIREGVASGDFTPDDIDTAVFRLSCLGDGLAVQLALADSEMTPEDVHDLWWDAARLELGIAGQR